MDASRKRTKKGKKCGPPAHDHVSNQRKVKTAPHLAKDSYECVSRTDRAEQRQAAVATACDEMQVLLPVVPLQR